MGSYAAKTAALSLAEHGAYTLLLDAYYSTETPLPASLDGLCRMCRAMTKPEQAAVRAVAEAFFPVGADGLRHNARADEEIAKAQSAISKQRDSGRLAALKRWGPNGSAGGSEMEPPDEFEDGSTYGLTYESTDGLPHQQTDNQTDGSAIQPQSLNQKKESKDLSDESDALARFWSAYPRKDAKAKALPAFRNQKAAKALDAILADIESRRQEWTDRQFIPMPASYLNARRWEDERNPAATGDGFGVAAI